MSEVYWLALTWHDSLISLDSECRLSTIPLRRRSHPNYQVLYPVSNSKPDYRKHSCFSKTIAYWKKPSQGSCIFCDTEILPVSAAITDPPPPRPPSSLPHHSPVKGKSVFSLMWGSSVLLGYRCSTSGTWRWCLTIFSVTAWQLQHNQCLYVSTRLASFVQ